MSELIEKLRDEVQNCEYLQKSGMLIEELQGVLPLLKEAITALESLPVWVKCEERLPPGYQGTCAVLTKDGSILTAWPAYWHGCRRDFAEWIFPIDCEDEMIVTHWMPLPLPPAVEKEG